LARRHSAHAFGNWIFLPIVLAVFIHRKMEKRRQPMDRAVAPHADDTCGVDDIWVV
jgi:hypothetical protein